MRDANLGKLDLLLSSVVVLGAIVATILANLEYRNIVIPYFQQARQSAEREPDTTITSNFKQGFAAFRTFLTASTLGLGLLLLTRPGSLRGRRWPSPGIAAIAVGSLVISMSLIWHSYLCWKGEYWYTYDLKNAVVWGATQRSLYRTGRAIVGAWCVLWIAGKWRGDGTALDRIGRLIGWSWIASESLRATFPLVDF
jgi:hypothetical protein